MMRRCAFFLILSFLLFSTWAPLVSGENFPDAQITASVTNKIRNDPATQPDAIDVYTIEGVVTLTGKAGSLLAKKRARLLAETVQGVRSVINRIEVQPATSVDDQELRKEIAEAFAENPGIASDTIAIEVVAGHVALRGEVDFWAQKDLAGTIASSVRGVKEVENELLIRPPRKISDHEILNAVRSRLRWDALTSSSGIIVRVDQGIVWLRGTVSSAAERRRILRLAGVTGVTDIQGQQLRVQPGPSASQSTEGQGLSDEEIRKAIEAALLYDPRVDKFNVRALVQNGVVSLEGEVETLAAKRAAAGDALHTVGVRGLQNMLEVQPGLKVPDQILARTVRSALRRDPYLEKTEIAVEVVDGTVWLTGPVGSAFEKDRAEYVLSGIDGIRAVKNNLTTYGTD